MDKRYLFSIVYVLFVFSSVTARENVRERVFVHTDKECYVAGEDIWLKLYTVDQNSEPSGLSKVGYVEISDSQRPWMQLMLALEEGSGAGKIEIPFNLPSGNYQLSGYTRYMRNEGEDAFFNKQIAIVNVALEPDPEKIEFVGPEESIQNVESDYSVLVTTDKNKYSTRELVSLSLNNLPDDIEDLVVSVYREDSIISLLEVNKDNWKKPFAPEFSATKPLVWDAECEGHIMKGQVMPKPDEKGQILSSASFVGNDINYIRGKIDPEEGSVSFYTSEMYGPREVVTSVTSNTFQKTPNRIDLVSPFSENLPGSLPPLQIVLKEDQLLERYIGAQLKYSFESDSPLSEPKSLSKSYYNLPVSYSYVLDNYTRFGSIDETILEFVNYVFVKKVEGKKRISIFLPEKNRFNTGNVLVFLDGVPIHDHEDLLSYNPQHIKRIDIYDKQYVFGGIAFESMISFITHQENLPFFQLSDESQLFVYDCPRLPESLNIPDYSIESVLPSRKADFRHTLYWNPFIEIVPEENMELSFYTSDLCGRFKVTVEGITRKGEVVWNTSYFDVSE